MTDKTREEMTKRERQIIEFLLPECGALTRDVARVVDQFGVNGHQHSGAVRAWLLDLERRGLVRRLDAEKPVVWALTERGNAIRKEFSRIVKEEGQ